MMRTAKWFLALALLAGLGQTARAGLIPAAVSVTSGGGHSTFSYTIILPSDYLLKPGDYFTIYDFKGFVGGSNLQPGSWTFSSPMLGVTPPHIAPSDDPGIPNLSWTYTGSPLTGPQSLGEFSADTTGNGRTFGDFTSRDHRAADGRAVGNITTTLVPDVIPGGPKDAPEPATLILFGAALPVLGLLRWMRRKT